MCFVAVHTGVAWIPLQEHCHVEKEFMGKQLADKK